MNMNERRDLTNSKFKKALDLRGYEEIKIFREVQVVERIMERPRGITGWQGATPFLV